MFGKLEATASMNTTGVGLGLSICKKIIEALDGNIYLAPQQERQGTKFVFELKLKEVTVVDDGYSAVDIQ